MEVGPGRSSPGGRTVSDILDAWVQQNLDTWAPSSARDQQSRVRGIKLEKIAATCTGPTATDSCSAGSPSSP